MDKINAKKSFNKFITSHMLAGIVSLIVTSVLNFNKSIIIIPFIEIMLINTHMFLRDKKESRVWFKILITFTVVFNAMLLFLYLNKLKVYSYLLLTTMLSVVYCATAYFKSIETEYLAEDCKDSDAIYNLFTKFTFYVNILCDIDLVITIVIIVILNLSDLHWLSILVVIVPFIVIYLTNIIIKTFVKLVLRRKLKEIEADENKI